MTHRGPFQPLPFCDKLITSKEIHRYKLANLHGVVIHTSRVPEVSLSLDLISLQISRWTFPWFLAVLQWDLPVLPSPASTLFPLVGVLALRRYGGPWALGCWAVADADGYPSPGSDSAFPMTD